MSRTALAAIIILFINSYPSAFYASGQEFAGHIDWNPLLLSGCRHMPAAKSTAATLTLPFFEDFTGYSYYPDSNKWTDWEVYVNNTMGASPVSRGVATFDGLDKRGIPYDSFSYTNFRYADSLTSQQIDISTNTPADSVYLSFFYQPQGNGFYPLLADSLMLYFKNRYGDFVKVWSVQGTALQPFQQVMIPVTDTLYFHNGFQFRFVNKAALYWADAVWNVDYIRMDRNRSMGDTAVTDIAFTANPSYLLNDYTSMPYAQFKANHAGELVSQVTDSIRNNTPAIQPLGYSMISYDVGTGALLTAAGPNTTNLPGYQAQQVVEPVSIGTFPSYAPNSSVVFRTKYYLQTSAAIGSIENDTIVHDQVFDNYLAYDDGTAEKSYYLNLFPSLPGRIQVEYHLNLPDTLRGMAIYFGRQVPIPSTKLFSIYIYSTLKGVNGAPADVLIDSTDFVYPSYADSLNHFWIYKLNRPVLMPAGTFYMGTFQPYGGGSDSLYIGLDVNRVGPNHAYYNVVGTWMPSLISGALMMRPLLGHPVSGSSVRNISGSEVQWHVYPNPARDLLHLGPEGDVPCEYTITDIQGHVLIQGKMQKDGQANISALAPGMYFVSISVNGLQAAPQKFIKL